MIRSLPIRRTTDIALFDAIHMTHPEEDEDSTIHDSRLLHARRESNIIYSL
jgi:hypothetical protein